MLPKLRDVPATNAEPLLSRKPHHLTFVSTLEQQHAFFSQGTVRLITKNK